MKVRKIRDGRGAVLVEWVDLKGSVLRGWLPPEALDGDWNVEDAALKKAAPYGLPFEVIFSKTVIKPDELANALRKHGIWTSQDVHSNPRAIVESLLVCLGFHVSQIQTWVREFDRNR